ncbi:N-acetylmuramic acid 6-phosphate etherase [Sporanaerobacter acetigenes]|uniref:N-acetylmuramic acid 6-phosphate etherase n=1 Tax=Sporanaerobacter acetigenes TaxID=165813 RepID=UPI00332BBDDA
MTNILDKLSTEKRNLETENLDKLSTLEMVTLMNNEDKKVSAAIERVLPDIALGVDAIAEAFQMGGRLIYTGAGTSGRLGILDASECPPTFGTEPEMVVGIIAGGLKAMTKAVEKSEDNFEAGCEDLKKIKLSSKDIVCGISASGRTPYVKGGLKYAREINCKTIAISNNLNAEISQYGDIKIEVDCGPEILTGSTRLKSGTAQKMVLNMLTTLSMVKIGKVYKNLMVDVKATNEKLVERTKKIVMEATNCNYKTAEEILKITNFNVKVAIVMIILNCNYDEAKNRIDNSKGYIRKAIQ